MRIDHVGVAVENIDAAVPFYRDLLGLSVLHREEVASQRVRVAFLGDSSGDEPSIELLEPVGLEGAVAKFLKDRGPGLHHVAFRAKDIEGAMRGFKESGRPALDPAPRPGARGHRVCFLHPKYAHGVLVELVG